MSSTQVRAGVAAALAYAGFAASALWSQQTERWSSHLASLGFAASTLLGGLALLMIGYAAHARWLLVFRRPLEAIALSLPLLVLLVAPLAIASFMSGHRAGWLELRSALDIVVWLTLAELLRRGSVACDHQTSSWLERSRTALSSVGIPLLGITGTLATFDGLMCAVPGWNMTGLALYALTGGFVSALGTLAVCFWWLRRRGVLPVTVGAEHSHALGRLLLSGVCLWAYLGASQLIIVWSANLPREAVFYLPRAAAGWRAGFWLLVFGHFVAPFLLLLLREPKRRPSFVALVGAWLVLMHAFDCYWLVVPSLNRGPRVLDVLPFALSAVALAAFGAMRFSFSPPLPQNEPELERSLQYEAS